MHGHCRGAYSRIFERLLLEGEFATGSRLCVVLVVLLALAPSATVVAADRPGELPAAPSDARRPPSTDPAIADLVTSYGISVEDAQNRLAWQQGSDVLDAAVRDRLGDRYAGVWIDHADGGRFKIGLAGSGRPPRRPVPERFAAAADLVATEFSWSQLEDAFDALAPRAATISRDDAWGIAIGFYTSINRLLVQAPPATERSAAVQSFLDDDAALYSEMLELVVMDRPPGAQACTSNTATPHCDPPLRAGVSIRVTINGSTTVCTGGFPARSRSDGTLFMMTAGHCLRNRIAIWQTSTAGGSSRDIGGPHACVAGNGAASNCAQGGGDMGIMRVNDPPAWQGGRGWVFVRPSASNGGIAGTTRNESYAITHDGVSGQPRTGFRLCKAGRVSTSCGELVAGELRAGRW